MPVVIMPLRGNMHFGRYSWFVILDRIANQVLEKLLKPSGMNYDRWQRVEVDFGSGFRNRPGEVRDGGFEGR